MLWALFEGDGPLLLEEPELSLHTEVVRQLPQVVAQMQMEIGAMRHREEDPFARQLIVTTHADELLRDASIGAHEVVLVRPGSGDDGATLDVADEGDREALRTTRLTPADVLLPKTRTTPSIVSLL
jgi:predicted ATPase